mmetsp:Transcript_3034/g.7186  ORF Transcript_3034/g.7186 Transcript_3034/m.7186 type:complete len:181 (-) Transcript_3034:110-652(-)
MEQIAVANNADAAAALHVARCAHAALVYAAAARRTYIACSTRFPALCAHAVTMYVACGSVPRVHELLPLHDAHQLLGVARARPRVGATIGDVLCVVSALRSADGGGSGCSDEEEYYEYEYESDEEEEEEYDNEDQNDVEESQKKPAEKGDKKSAVTKKASSSTQRANAADVDDGYTTAQE